MRDLLEVMSAQWYVEQDTGFQSLLYNLVASDLEHATFLCLSFPSVKWDSKIISHSIIIKLVCMHAQLP